jgi:putative oxidoreductase
MRDLGLLVLRVVAGGTLIAHGYTKLFGGEGRTPQRGLAKLYGQKFDEAVQGGGPAKFAKMLEQMQVPYPGAAAYASGLAELGGGLALLTGTMTRLAALAVLVNMLVAIRKVHWSAGFYGQDGFEYPAQLAAEALTLFFAGPGALSVDGVFNGFHRAGRAAVGAGQAVADTLPDVEDLRRSAGNIRKLAR